ncbi:CRISPR-associated helicase Cas3' [Sphingomonas sp. 2R-10]|uniref:CRISPR-associated helicase Cas3' n=1 Tax=Sphingomonas sp. 2R-10 TaxID=3045148 RepID=UPI0013DDDAF7|nr:CRISPR-associated helicase Cas3' [Sphingomonas sp. 2R-10]MDJ0278316.1 CRISPR-associated helicase Cas3' [Sphingomonas sp. 2R-10]
MTNDLPRPWAKLIRNDDKVAIAALPLVDHCLDVGAAGEAVLQAWAGPLEAAAGRPLTGQDVARLVVLMALHDLGKANRGFQARIDPKREPVGHTAPVAALLTQSQLCRTPVAVAIHAMLADWGATEHFAAVMAHHGRPLKAFASDAAFKDWTDYTKHWMPKADGDPAAAVLPLLDAVRTRWPLAWEAGPPLPDAPRFVALFAGLVTLADWLGSDEARFPVDGPHGAARAVLRDEQVAAAAQARGFLPLDTPPGDFKGALGFDPFPFQTDAARDDLGPVALIEAETGSGKTEAALWRWLELRRRGAVDGLFFALPTRSAAVQLHRRVNAILQRVWGPGGIEAVLAVPGYLQAGDAKGQALPGYAVRWDDGAAGDERWAAERANRFLAARVAVGTIDQALLGVLPIKHALFRSSVLTRSLLVVDEVHASDAYMTGLLERLLDHHVAAGGRALLLSATLGAAARARLLHRHPVPSQADAAAVPYPALSGSTLPPVAARGRAGGKPVRIEVAPLLDDAQAIAARAVAAARAGAAVLVVRNSVPGAIAVAQAVAEQADELAFKVAAVATLHHGRFAPCDRRQLDDAVTQAFGKGRKAGGQVLVGTQTLEQSLDIDADLLITDLAPIDVLLQRIGRLHRHPRADRGAFAAARAIVLRPAGRDLAALLGRTAAFHGLGGSSDRSPYPNLIQLEATLRLIEATPDIVIPRDNRRLVEDALHPDALAAVAASGSAAWTSHGNDLSGGATVALQTARQVALDFRKRFRDIAPFDPAEAVATRLGARDLLLDLPRPLSGPFGGTIDRIAIPGWMVPGIGGSEPVEPVDAQRFRLGKRPFRYDQWGLQAG